MLHLHCNNAGFYHNEEGNQALFSQGKPVDEHFTRLKTRAEKALLETEYTSPLGYKLNEKNSILLDLSETAVPKDSDWNNQLFFDSYIKNKCEGKIGYGGYLEKRVFYKRSSVFTLPGEFRNIHLGTDLWTASQTPIYAAMDGEVYGFANNNNPADYGYTLVLKHQLKNIALFTLYGHLSSYGFDKLKMGACVKQGEEIARLGAYSENGNWPPHLHFQVMTTMFGLSGDYPGVCFEWQKPFFETLCLNSEKFLR